MCLRKALFGRKLKGAQSSLGYFAENAKDAEEKWVETFIKQLSYPLAFKHPLRREYSENIESRALEK